MTSTAVVKRAIHESKKESRESFGESLKIGFRAITDRKGVWMLILVSSVITCFMGALQILAEPMILDFAGSATLGAAETLCASGMLVSGVFLGARGIRKNYVKVLVTALIFAGIGMIGFGLKENVIVICVFGFIFFAALPFANNCLDYLVRTNIPDELQGRAWGVIGFLSQIGYVVAYGISGIVADGIAEKFSIGVGRGAAVVVMAAGLLLVVTAGCLYPIKSIRELERSSVCEKD